MTESHNHKRYVTRSSWSDPVLYLKQRETVKREIKGQKVPLYLRSQTKLILSLCSIYSQLSSLKCVYKKTHVCLIYITLRDPDLKLQNKLLNYRSSVNFQIISIVGKNLSKFTSVNVKVFVKSPVKLTPFPLRC